MDKKASGLNKLVVPAVRARTRPAISITGKKPHVGGKNVWAPAWFHSALAWIGQWYYDANNVRQRFQTYLAGSDVDPYAQIGATRLFLVTRSHGGFRLSIATDVDAIASAEDGDEFPFTDEGVRDMYMALAESDVFARANYCYVPCRIGIDLEPDLEAGSLQSGYDPATGLRAIVNGSAVSQIVPLDEFLKARNEQIYNPAPAIVPLVSALVYDITQHNTLGATTFDLPTFYARDRITPTTHYVHRIDQTVLFPGGPGYEDAAATDLTLKSTTTAVAPDHVLTTYTFDRAKVATISTLKPRVQTGISAFTYSGSSPTALFGSQRIVGFYRESGWTKCFGQPMYDFGPANDAFKATSSKATDEPTLIYDPAHGSLNGGALQNVVHTLQQARLLSWDRLVYLLDNATTTGDDRAHGLAVTAADLAFELSSPPPGPIVDHLDVPVVVTVTMTPKPPPAVRHRTSVEAAARPAFLAKVIGGGANAPVTPPSSPTSTQLGLVASVPREALSGTSISSIQIGTAFPEQALGSSAAFRASSTPRVVNVAAHHQGQHATGPVDVALSSLGVELRDGIYYVLAATNQEVSVRGSDGTNQTARLSAHTAADTTYVGALIHGADSTSVRLYPKLHAGIAAPTVGTHGVLQGSAYSIRVSVGEKHSTYDLLDAAHVVVASNVQVKTPKLSDGSTARAGDLLFGGFLGGAAEVTVWSVPVFVTVAPTDLPAGTFDGAIALDAQVSGVPAYKLHVTDSSVFVYYNIDVGLGTAGAPNTTNVFLASAVINTAPDDRSAQAFAPSRVVMGLVCEVVMGTARKYVFIPAEDSIVIGGVRYLLSVIELEALTCDPEDRPYPPSFWPRTQFWQFANRHDPYVDVRYSGETQADRIAIAREDSKRIGHEVRRAREPMHMYLDTDRELMTVWPIIGFPFDRATQNIDRGELAAITGAVLELIADAPAMTREKAPRPLDNERIIVPDALLQVNPYAGAAPAAKATVSRALAMEVAAPAMIGKPVTSLAGPMLAANVSGIDTHESVRVHAQERAIAANAVNKSMLPGIEVLQDHEPVLELKLIKPEKRKPVIYGYSVFNRRTGEAYLIELIDADQEVPDQLPHPTQHITYDPFYVRVVDLATLTAYNMSIIVPAMVHDQYGHFATVNTTYDNLLAKTDELKLGYMYSLFDAGDAFDSLTFRYTSASRRGAAMMAAGTHALFTNVPYALQRGDDDDEKEREPYFVCRRRNWSADCHLMKATRLEGRSVYLAFGAGDLVPFRLDADFTIDKRPPAHLYKLTYTFTDRQYNAAKMISVGNKPYVVAVTTQDGAPQYMNFSINSTSGTADLSVTPNTPLDFPKEIYVVGSASTTLISIDDINAQAGTMLRHTGDLMTLNDDLTIAGQEFQLIPYNNLVYLVRAVANVAALGTVGNLGTVSGLLIDTYVPATSGNLALAQGARHKRSGLSYFGASYTPTTMVDTLDNLDFTSITGEKFLVPTIFIPIPELDATRGFVADISNFLGQQFWTFIYPEIVAHSGATTNGVTWTRDVNIDVEGKPVLSMQKLHFVYDPLVVLFTPNDLSHKYALQPKQQVLALTNGQIQEGICWRSANVQPQRDAPTNICAQQIVPPGPLFDRPNIIYSSHNRAVDTSNTTGFLGMSVNSFFSVSGVTYSIEESALQNDQTATSFISAVSSTTNMLVGVLFDYDNNDLGNLVPYDRTQSTKGIVFLNGYLSAAGYSFSSPDHFDVNDVLPSQVPRLEQIANTLGEDVAFFETDVSLPRQFWSMTYDTFTAPGVPGFISNVPPSLVDPTFANRTRSLILSLQNPLRPDQLGLMDTFSSVVSANIHLQNGVTGSVFISKKADRDVASIGTNPVGPNSFPLYGLPTKYDFFIFSRDHYWTLKGASFELVDQGYAMCLVDDGSGTGTKVAKYFVDADGNYYELFTYALYSPNGGLIETSSFTVRVSLGAPGNVSASPIIPATPNNVNPQDIAAQINKVSNLVYAAFGPSSSGQPPAFIPIQAVSGAVQATPIIGPPDFGGYRLNVAAANRQPVQISQLYSGTVTYPIAGSTAVAPLSKSGKAQPFLGSLSHGLDRMLPWPALSTADHTVVIPRTAVPAGPSSATLGGNGLGALIGTPFSCAFQGSGAVPPAIAANPTPGTTMKADDTVFYSFNAVTSTVMDSTGKSATASGTYYFVDKADTANPIYAVVTLPRFTLNGNTYAVNLSTTLADGTTSRYSLVVGGKTYLFGPDNAHVTVDRTTFTFQPISGDVYNVLCTALDAPTGDQAPATIALTPFSVTAGGVTATIDVFNNAGALNNILLGIAGRQYAFDPVHGRITIKEGPSTRTTPLETGIAFASASLYGYVIGFDGTSYTVNGTRMVPYSASTTGTPATHALMTAPKMFTLGGNFYTFDQDASGGYTTVTGNRSTYKINPYQFSINGAVYIINTNVQPNTVIGGGNVYPMTAGNTQFLLNGVQYTIALKQNSLNGATISGQFNVTQGNVVVLENYVYQIDNLNGRIVGNGTAYPLTASGVTYTITSADRSFTVTTEPNATTVTLGNIVYQINNTTVVGEGITYPILPYRTFVDGASTYRIGIDGVVSVPAPFTLSGAPPYTKSTFTDGATFTVNDLAAFDGTTYFRISGSPPQFTTPGRVYALRTDGVSITAGGAKTYLVKTTGALSPNQFTFGPQTINLDRPQDVAAFDGQRYYAIANNQFTDTVRGATYTLSGNTAVHDGNSYEIYSNLGQGAYFQVPGGPLYYVNIPVADTGSASGDIFHVFPVSGGQFTMPIQYSVTVAAGVVTVNGLTFAAPTTVATLTGTGSLLTGGFFTDPVTKITYTCVVDGTTVTFVDSNNVVYPFSTDAFIATAVVATGVTLAVDDQATPAIYPVLNNQFLVGTTTYSVNIPIAYQNAAGPYFPMVNGRFIVPRVAPLSNLAYTVSGGTVTKGFVVSADDQFSADGNVVYTVNEVNVVKATNQATLAGSPPTQTLTAGALSYTLDSATSRASIQPAGLAYNSATSKFTVSYNGLPVTYTVGASMATDDRSPGNSFAVTMAGTIVTFTDSVTAVTFRFDGSGSNPITASFVYINSFFTDAITGTTYYIDQTGARVEALSYLPETTSYAFTPADGQTYLIHYDHVDVVFPVVAGRNVNAGVATVGANTFSVSIDEVNPISGASAIPTNANSFEINGNLYTITGTPSGTDYSTCFVVGNDQAPRPFLTPNTFRLGDPSVTYTLQLDAANLPRVVVASFAIRPSRNLLTINDAVYIITYNTVSTGSLLGQGQAAIAITNSSFMLTNRFDTTKAKFIFADLDIYNAASVVGQFTSYLAPTFVIDGVTYTLDPVRLTVTDADKRPYPLLPNPTMFSINGFNYVIDSNRIPHAIIGNSNISPLATDVTVESGEPIPSSTFTLNGQIYKYTESATRDLLTITGTKSYMLTQPALTFKLDSSLLFTLNPTPPAAGNFAGTVVPIGTVTAGLTVLNVYAGTPESGGADFFTYKNVLYTFVKSGGAYVAIQKSYTVYAARPAAGQQQLAVFDLDGTTYIATDGSTAGEPAKGVNPATMWAATATSSTETQFGLVYGFAAQPTTVTRSGTGLFQFSAVDSAGTNTLYDIVYTAGENTNVVKVDVPALLPTFTQTGPFTFTPSYPLTFETGGYNAFTTFVAETSMPSLSFAAAYKTPVTSSDPLVDSLITEQGDFSLEFWHSIPATTPNSYHPATYNASSPTGRQVFFVDVDFENDSDIFIGINNTVLHAVASPPVFSSGWRHVALTYNQSYTIACQGAGFEVKRGDNYNFNRDFSIAMTFSASDVTTAQGLLYKGSGADTAPPQLDMSYRVAISGGAVTLQLTDGEETLSPVFTGPPITAGTFFELIIVKHTITPAGRDDSPDPYAAPFDTSDFGPTTENGMIGQTEGFKDGAIKISSVAPAGTGATTKIAQFMSMLANPPPKAYRVLISVRPINADGTPASDWVTTTTDHTVARDPGLLVSSSGNSHLVIGGAFDDAGQAVPLGSTTGATGNIRKVYLFNTAIDRRGVRNEANVVVDIAAAEANDLIKAGLVGCWAAAYDPDGVVRSPLDVEAIALSTNQARAFLAPITGHEAEGAKLFVNGYPMTLSQVDPTTVLAWTGYSAGSAELTFNAGAYRLSEISVWRGARQAYQVIDDMFGRLIPTNEPLLAVYLSGSFQVQAINAPILPMKKYIDNIAVTNPVAELNLAFSPASLDLAGCPAVGRCGPLITPNLYTPPAVALTVCDSVPSLATYSVTLNNATGALAGEINEAYVYIKNDVLTLYAGKKVGDLVMSWVSQEQGDVQVIGYIEGAPPAPMANLTNKTSYPGATSVTLSAPTSVTLKYSKGDDFSKEIKNEFTIQTGLTIGLGFEIAPFGFGVKSDAKGALMGLTLGFGGGGTWTDSDGTAWSQTSQNKLDETNRYTVKLQGALAPYAGDLFMAGLNSVTTPSTTVGNPSSRTAILPNPNLGGFTASNPPAALPRAPTDEKFGARMYVPSPYGQAFVSSTTLDVYQQRLLQTNTVYGFVRLPNALIPRDLNVVSYRINSKYLRPGCIDGMIGYAYNPATLPNGTQTYTTSTGEMAPLYDKNFSPGTVGHDASYMRIVEAYKLKRQIDQQAFNALALYGAQYNARGEGLDNRLTPGLDFYNEYIWTSRGGTQEVKHTYTTTYEESYTATTSKTKAWNINFNIKLAAMTVTVVDFKFGHTETSKDVLKYTFTGTGTSSFDITASFDGIENDTQMRYGAANDAHFVMKFNSMFNPSNQSGLNLVVGSDGLVYQIAPSVQSGAGLPTANNIDDSMTYMQPQPAYSSGNANGLTGNLEPYDRPGKVKQFRTYAFYLQPSHDNALDFWDSVIDRVWLANSDEPDARAMRSAFNHASRPWRLLYRVTYCERFLPPVSNASLAVPQITPVMAVPVLEPVTDFLFKPVEDGGPRPPKNPANDIEANIVLIAPTSSGARTGTLTATATRNLPNNMIPFDLVKNAASIVSWGDSANAKLMTQLLTSVLGLNTVAMSPTVLPGSTKQYDVMDPVSGGPLYSVYVDPNGFTVNVPTSFGVTVYQDVNGNPIQYFDGKTFHSLQADYIATTDGTVMYYIQPPSTYDQSAFDLAGDYDLYGRPGDEWRFYLVSGFSANMTSEPTVAGVGPFLSSSGARPFTGFRPATAMHASGGANQVKGYVLVQGILQWPHLNTNAETFADVQVYKAMSLLDTFPIGDPEVLISFMKAQYPEAPFVDNAEICLVFGRNIVSYFNTLQQALLPQ